MGGQTGNSDHGSSSDDDLGDGDRDSHHASSNHCDVGVYPGELDNDDLGDGDGDSHLGSSDHGSGSDDDLSDGDRDSHLGSSDHGDVGGILET